MSGEKTKLNRVQDEVDAVVGIMHNNLDAIIQRDDRLHNLADSTEQLKDYAGDFKKGSSRLRNTMWWKNCKMNFMISIICVVILSVVIVVIIAATGGFNKG
jgi:hypothetical protein